MSDTGRVGFFSEDKLRIVSTRNAIEAELAAFRKVAARLPLPQWASPVRFGGGTPAAEVDALESLLSAPLPADYRAFLEVCGEIAAADVWNGYFLHPAGLVAETVRRRGPPGFIRRGAHADSVVTVGSDGGGNAFFVPIAGVWKWLHESGTQEGGLVAEGAAAGEPGRCRLIAPDFLSFLQRLRADWEHFAAGDDEWPYLSG